MGRRSAPPRGHRRSPRSAWSGRTGCRPSPRRAARFTSSAISYTIGYQMAPENCSQCRSTGPCDRSWARSLVRQSFWSTRIDSPSITTSAESPPGPSVIDDSMWIATRTPGAISISSVSTVRTNSVNPSPASVRRCSRVGKSGSRIGMSRRRWARSHGSSWWSPCRCETYRKSARSMRSSQVVAQPVVAGEREPRSEERGHEPGIAQDRNPARLDEQTGMADGGRPHQAVAGTPGSAPYGRASGDRGIGELLTGARHVLGPGGAVPVAQLVATRRIGVPARQGPRTRPVQVAAAGSSATAATTGSGSDSVSVASGAVPHPAGSSTGSTAGSSATVLVSTTGVLRRRCLARLAPRRPARRRQARARTLSSTSSVVSVTGRRTAEVGDDVGARRHDRHDVPPVGRLLGQQRGEGIGVVGRGGDGRELLHAG